MSGLKGTPMTKRCLAVFTVVCLVVSAAPAAIFNLNHNLGGQSRRLRLNIPPSVQEVRGILIYGNGAGGDATNRATNSELVAFAESQGFAVLATGLWGGFFAPDDSEMLGFEAMLEGLAQMSGHPELVDAPWLPMGHSNGGQMSYGFAAKRPWKVIGFITSKGGYYTSYRPSTASLQVPGMLIAGQNDAGYRITAVRRLFEENRPRGALWAWVEEEGTGHEQADAQQLKLTFLAECVRLRYPVDQSPVNGPVTLKDLHECHGWLVDQRTWRMGLTAIYPYAAAPEDKRLYGWVPNEKIARYYQAFSSYGKASQSVGGTLSPTTAPTTLIYTLRLQNSFGRRGGTSVPVTGVQFFLNGQPLAEGVPEQGVDPTISVEQHVGGLQAFSAIVTYESGVQKATHLRRVFVRGPRPASAFEQWASTHLPDANEGPLGMLFEGGVTHIERFAFGLGLDEYPGGFDPIQPADPPIENIEGTDYAVYTYEVNEAAVAAGLNIMPQVSADGEHWANVVHIDDPDYAGTPTMLLCVANTVTVKVPQRSTALQMRIRLSDTYEGQ